MIDVAVLVCGDLVPSGLDPEALRAALPGEPPPITVVDHLCRAPAATTRRATELGARRVVAAVCDHDASLETLAARLVRGGVEPLGMEPVVLDPVLASGDGAGRAHRLIAAAVARLAAAPRGDAATTRLRLAEGTLDRRALLTLPPVRYAAVAAVDKNTCVGTDRCGRCVGLCPVDAISVSSSRATVNRDACTGCGLCVSVCPTGAIALPGASLEEHTAGFETLIAGGGALAITCRHSAPRFDHDEIPAPWVPVEVPCAGMVTTGWILQALCAGASDVAVISCGSDCRCDTAQRVDNATVVARQVLDAVGADAGRVRSATTDRRDAIGVFADPVSRPVAEIAAGRVTLREPDATAGAVTSMARALGATSATPIGHDLPPLGIVAADDQVCTLCGACPTVCPTDALRLDEDQDRSVLRFDPHRCIACGHCTGICPEDALTLTPGIQLVQLLAGPTVLAEDEIAHCQQCGAPIGPAAMLARVVALLGDENSVLRAAVTERCNDCRGLVGPPGSS
jgi:ferredoxin